MNRKEIITLEVSEFESLISKIESLEKVIKEGARQYPFKEQWLTSKEVCEVLKISTRTLQQFRDNKEFSYSRIGGKMYYKSSDIEGFLIDNYQ